MDLDHAVQPTLACPHWSLRLDHHQRNTVHQQDQIGALLCGTGPECVLRSDDMIVASCIGEIEQADGNMLAILAEGHGPLTGQPGGELFVGLHQSIAPHAHDYGAELIEYIVCPVRLGGDLRVQSDQRLAYP